MTLASYKLVLEGSESIIVGDPKPTHGEDKASPTKEPEVISSLSEIIKKINEKIRQG